MKTRPMHGNALDGIARPFGIGARATDMWFEPFGMSVDDVMGDVLRDALERLVPAGAFDGHDGPAIYPVEGEPNFLWAGSPAADQGLAVVLDLDAGEDEDPLVALYPFANDGEEHEIAVEEVLVSDDRSQGVVVGTIGDLLPVAFHDVRFAVTRCAHAKGSAHFVKLSGFVHSIERRVDQPIVLEAGSPAAERLRSLIGTPADEDNEAFTLSTAGLASIIPVMDELPTFYDVTGTVRYFGSYQYEILGRQIWKLVVTVAEVRGYGRKRSGGKVDLTLFATDLVLDRMDERPEEGQDIAARIRLQGYISIPNVHLLPTFDGIRY